MEHLPSKHESLNSNPSTTKKRKERKKKQIKTQKIELHPK
jgi:hypothetical protein